MSELNDSDDEYDEEGAEYLEMLSKQRVSVILFCFNTNPTSTKRISFPVGKIAEKAVCGSVF